jgi:tetratricopeptide (TPR) repeat protein
MALHGSRSDIFIWHRYYVPSYAMAALLAGLGLHLGTERLRRGWRRGLRLAALGLPLALLIGGWRMHDRSGYRIAEDFARRVLRAVEPGAHLSATDDNVLFVLIYLHLVEGLRPDLDLILQGVGGAELPNLRFDPDTDGLYFTHHPNWSAPQLEIVPVGPVFSVMRAGRPAPTPAIESLLLDGEADPQVPKDYLTQNLIGHFHFMLGQTYEHRAQWLEARRQYAAAAAAAPDNDVMFYNLGLIYQRNGLYAEALSAFRRSHEINPRHIASRSAPRAEDRVRETEAELRRLTALEHQIEAELQRLEAEKTPGADPAVPALRPGSAGWHLRLAESLRERGEPLAARGHELKALEAHTATPAR